MSTPPRSALLATGAALLLTACPPDPAEEPTPTPTPDEDEDVAEGEWRELAEAPIPPRLNHTATWADGEVIVWGGEDQDTFEIAVDGAAYDPAADEWRTVPDAPIEGRWAHEAVWTGDELLVWGGTAGPDHLAACYTDGARYDPAGDAWHVVAEAPGEPRCGAAMVWTGSELIAFGGHSAEGPPGPDDRHDDGVAYDPEADEWRTLPPAPIPARADAVAAWTGSEVVVYGGHTEGDNGFSYRNDGAAYDPEADGWRALPDSPLPPLSGLAGLAIDGEVMVFGGQDPDDQDHHTGAAAYDPAEDAWRTLADLPEPQADPRVAWTGDVVYVLGGGAPDGAPAGDHTAFVAYVPGEDGWVPRPYPPDGPRMHHALAWTGADLVVWGGQTEEGPAPGALWDPPG